MSIKITPLASLACFSVFLLGADLSITSPTQALDLIQSANPEDRLGGQVQLVRYRADTIQALLAIIEAPRRKEDDGWLAEQSVRNTAIKCAGEYRAVETIESLVKLLEPQAGESFRMGRTFRLCPAAGALVEIGNPSIPDLVDLLRSSTKGWADQQARQILFDIEGLDRGRLCLQKAIASETDQVKQTALKENLKSFEEEMK